MIWSSQNVSSQPWEVFVINPLRPSKKIRALILLDTGSQQSYISETLREKLQLVAREQQTITVSSIKNSPEVPYLDSGSKKNVRKDSGGYDSRLGKIFVGKTCNQRLQGQQETCRSLLTFTVLIEQDLSQFWALETIGIADPIDLIDDEEAYEFEKSVRRNDEGRYAISWPWKSPDPKIEFGDDKIIEPAPSETPYLKYYIPHLPVIFPDKCTKLRIVFDASAASRKGYSLNDQLYKGPTPGWNCFKAAIGKIYSNGYREGFPSSGSE
ncbi:unnamed protein product [Dracunculus medinensis]|uniref:DUF1758 domain-containing protein n=1 Tax=Dracunculus medinensis TaxID=318479 RepID=A0A0N4U3U9_DRAME|nr:unnamed protein product [Dracunculus medinensis]